MAVLENSKHEAFAQNLANGMSQRQAYRAAFPSSQGWKDTTVDAKACELANTDAVKERLQEIKEATCADMILDRQSRMIILSGMATNEQLAPKARLQAIDILNKMNCDYTQRIEAVVSSDISQTAAQVARILDS
jgi:hypothetical protein